MSIIIETPLLCPIATAIATARTEPIDLNQFFRTRPGLYVWDSFRERFELGVAPSAPERPYVASLLKSNAYDRNIRRELPENHLSTLEDIAGFIEAQPHGKEGFLLTNGYANMFYVLGKNDQVFNMDVIWHSDDHEWNVFDGTLDEDGGWRAKDQVLCPGNAAL